MLSFTRSFSRCISSLVITSRLNKHAVNYARQFSVTSLRQCAVDKQSPVESEEPPAVQLELTAEELKKQALDRTKIIPVETSIKYLKSSAYQETYGDYLVWQQYRRNHKGLYPPKKTRKTCVRQGKISCGNPCPICRDEYLVLDYRNVDLLKQFISQQTGEVLSYSKTGLCQKKHFDLLVAVQKAMDYGLLTFDVPFRQFNYSEYYSHLKAGNQA